jgi:hypothetical protein
MAVWLIVGPDYIFDYLWMSIFNTSWHTLPVDFVIVKELISFGIRIRCVHQYIGHLNPNLSQKIFYVKHD